MVRYLKIAKEADHDDEADDGTKIGKRLPFGR
jgi:hypothetical protein